MNILSFPPFILNRGVFVQKPSKDTRTLVVYNRRASKVKVRASENAKNTPEEESYTKDTPAEDSDVNREEILAEDLFFAKQKEIRLNQRKFKAEKRKLEAEKRKEAWEESKLKKKVYDERKKEALQIEKREGEKLAEEKASVNSVIRKEKRKNQKSSVASFIAKQKERIASAQTRKQEKELSKAKFIAEQNEKKKAMEEKVMKKKEFSKDKFIAGQNEKKKAMEEEVMKKGKVAERNRVQTAESITFTDRASHLKTCAAAFSVFHQAPTRFSININPRQAGTSISSLIDKLVFPFPLTSNPVSFVSIRQVAAVRPNQHRLTTFSSSTSFSRLRL